VRIKSQKDFFSGLMFMAIGSVFAWGATAYPLGSSARMGPGYFPLAVGVLLALLGGAITFKALVVETADGDKVGKLAWRPLAFVILANLVFGVAIGGLPVVGLPPLGMVVGIYLLTVVASLGGDHFKVGEALVLGTVLAALSYVAFVWLLQLQFPVWPAFFSA
jgi:hypothetical protein